MKIYFDNENAWGHLQAHGFVYTLRKFPERPIYLCQNVEIWRRGENTGEKCVRIWIDDVDIADKGTEFQDKVLQYGRHSGFDSVQNWFSAASDLSGRQPHWIVYLVFLIGEPNW